MPACTDGPRRHCPCAILAADRHGRADVKEERVDMRSHRILLTVAATALAIGTLAVPAQAAGSATLFVAHGIPGATVDVCANGAEIKSNFKYGRQFKAELPDGTYRVKVFRADPRPCKGTKVIDQQLALIGGQNVTAVAWLDKGAPALDVFINNLVLNDPFRASVTIRHVAKAPTLDFYLAGTLLGTVPEPSFRIPRGEDVTGVEVADRMYAYWATRVGDYSVLIGPELRLLEESFAYHIHVVGTKANNYRFIVTRQPAIIT
jgi:hypothetical protein